MLLPWLELYLQLLLTSPGAAGAAATFGDDVNLPLLWNFIRIGMVAERTRQGRQDEAGPAPPVARNECHDATKTRNEKSCCADFADFL